MKSNTKKEFALDIDTIKEISYENYDKDFVFIVNKKRYYTPRIIADILSPKIRQYHSIDKTFDTFYIDIPGNTKCNFSKILSLASFNENQFTEDELTYFRNIFFLLGNKKEFIKLTPKYDEQVSMDNVFDRINIIEKYTILRDINKHYNQNEYKCNIDEIAVGNDLIREEIDFVASHFSLIDTKKIKNLNPSIIEDIISNRKLQLEDEDSLLRFITNIYSDNHKLSYLFENVNFLNVSQKAFQEFSSTFQYDDLSRHIWDSIIERTSRSQFDKTMNAAGSKAHKQEDREISLPYANNLEFKGIINYLTRKTDNNNIHDIGIIEVTSNYNNPDGPPRNLLDFNFNNKLLHYEAENGKDYAWICYDFKDALVKITNYSIKPANSGKYGYHPKSWDIETSNDGINWTTIDKQKDCKSLNTGTNPVSFQTKPSDYVRYVRFHQTSDPWGGGHIWFRAIEFYGFIEHL